MTKQPCNVINLMGEEEPFSSEKVYQSARRSGASSSLAKKIVDDVQTEAYPGIKTSEIFGIIKRTLKKEDPRTSIKFCLKKALKKMGPTGFPFEKYIGAIFENFGYEVRLNQQIPGLCITHEIDFLAKKGSLLYVGECKYRNLPQEGSISSSIALSNFARFLDLKEGKALIKNNQNIEIKSILVTNAKFTSSAAAFSKCRGVELLGWRHPKNKGLERFIESQNLYPITILPSLNNFLSQIFISNNIMLVKDFLQTDIKKFLTKNKIPIDQIERLTKEARILLG